MKAYVQFNYLLSDYAEVCSFKDQVVGFLFGLTDKKQFNKKQKSGIRKVIWRLMTGKYGKIRKKYQFLFNVALTSIKVEYLCKKFNSEVVLFVVDKEHRGKGLGRAMMDHFLEHLRRLKKHTVYLYTDVESNWKFYDIYGFRKYREFHDYELSFLRGKKTMSFLYYKTIKHENS